MLSILSFILLIGVLTVFAILQIYICKNAKNEKVGLILPIGSLIFGLLPIISIIITIILNFLPSSNVSSYIISYSLDFLPGIIIQIFNIIILIAILFTPTIIFTLIYLHYKK